MTKLDVTMFKRGSMGLDPKPVSTETAQLECPFLDSIGRIVPPTPDCNAVPVPHVDAFKPFSPKGTHLGSYSNAEYPLNCERPALLESGSLRTT
jgi:hypothetical protein